MKALFWAFLALCALSACNDQEEFGIRGEIPFDGYITVEP